MTDITNDDLADTTADELEGDGYARAVARAASARLLELLVKLLGAIGGRPAQDLHDQIADQIADGHAAERSFDRELRNYVLREWQFVRSFLAPVAHDDCEACHVGG